MSSRKTITARDNRLRRHEAFLRQHVLPHLEGKGWRLVTPTLHREPIAPFLCSLSIDLDDPQRVVGFAQADALFTDGMSAGFETWQLRAINLESRANAVRRLVARADEFFAPYATALSAARWLTKNPDLDPMEGEVTALIWALAGRPPEALKALSRAAAYNDSIEEEVIREFFRPITEGISDLERDLKRRPVALRRSLEQQIKRQIAAYRHSGFI